MFFSKISLAALRRRSAVNVTVAVLMLTVTTLKCKCKGFLLLMTMNQRGAALVNHQWQQWHQWHQHLLRHHLHNAGSGRVPLRLLSKMLTCATGFQAMCELHPLSAHIGDSSITSHMMPRFHKAHGMASTLAAKISRTL